MKSDECMEKGILPLSIKKKVLFTKKVEIRTGTLPRWKPHIIIDEESVALEDEE